MAVQISGNDITVPRDGTFSRNVSIAGTLTYEDVTNVDSIGLVTARNGIEVGASPGVAASISVDGNMIISGISTFGDDITFTGASANMIFDKSDNALEFNDDAKATFGTGADTTFTHSGADFAITNSTGNLNILNNSAEAVQIRHGSETMIKAISDGAVELYHDDSKKLETASGGVTVTGTVSATSFSGSGASLTGIAPFTEYSTQTVSGTDSYSITITGDPKVIEVSLFEVRHVDGQNIMYRLSNSGGETTSGYYDISTYFRNDHASNGSSRGTNQGQGCLVNYGFSGVNNLITGKAVFTRVNTGLYTFNGNYNHRFHANEGNNAQYNIMSNGHVDNNQNSGSTVTQIRIFTSSGGNFTSGSINVRGIA